MQSDWKYGYLEIVCLNFTCYVNFYCKFVISKLRKECNLLELSVG